MKKKAKKILCFVLCILLFTTSIQFVERQEVYAITRSEVEAKLQSLMNQYVGKTWNDSYYGIQCKGFANLMFYKLFNVVHIGAYENNSKYYIPSPSGATEVGRLDFSNMTQANATNLLKKGMPGDFIQVRRRNKTYGHSMILVGQDANGITVFDCNSDGKNGVKKYYITWASFYNSNSAMSLYHAKNYNPDPCSCSTSYAGDYIVTTDSLPLNIRNGHGGSIIDSVPKGTKVHVEKADGSWAHITYDGKNGCVSMQYLQKISTGHDPIGCVDIVEDKGGSIHVSGWAFDEDNTSKNIGIHIYAEGTPLLGTNTMVKRIDVDNVYHCGTNHGFDVTIPTNLRGTHTIHVFAINEGGGQNVVIGSKQITITDPCPQIRAWVSDTKMGSNDVTFKYNGFYYLCYELINPITGKRYDLSGHTYTIKETIYNPDGSVAYSLEYPNSNNNWIGVRASNSGTYRGKVEISGDYIGSAEVSYTIPKKDPVPQIHAWVSDTKMGSSDNVVYQYNGFYYLCYELINPETGKKYDLSGHNYSVKETIYKPDGSVAHSYEYANSNNNWIGNRATSYGKYRGKVEVSGDYTGSVEVDYTIPTPTPTPKVMPTPTPKVTPTPTPKVTPTPTPKITPTPTPKVTPTPVPSEPVVKLQVAASNAVEKAGSVVPVTVSLKNNPGISAITLNVDYDATVMGLQSIEDGKLLDGATLTTGQNLSARPYRMLWSIGTKDVKIEGTLVTLYFKLKEDVKDGTYPVNVTFEADDVFNTRLENVAAESINGSITVVSKTYTPGDVNGDGKVNTKDATLITQYYAGWNVSLNLDAADVNADGKVNTKDATLITQYYAGWQVELK